MASKPDQMLTSRRPLAFARDAHTKDRPKVWAERAELCRRSESQVNLEAVWEKEDPISSRAGVQVEEAYGIELAMHAISQIGQNHCWLSALAPEKQVDIRPGVLAPVGARAGDRRPRDPLVGSCPVKEALANALAIFDCVHGQQRSESAGVHRRYPAAVRELQRPPGFGGRFPFI